jgi:heme-degrading monooxygenase HmoA
MIEFVWEFVVKKETQGQFELAYGPGGEWSKLFSRQPGFRGTTLMRDMDNPLRYLVIDLWDSSSLREEMLADQASEYSALEASFDEWVASKTELGIFRVLAEATVRPRGRTHGSKARKSRRRGR